MSAIPSIPLPVASSHESRDISGRWDLQSPDVQPGEPFGISGYEGEFTLLAPHAGPTWIGRKMQGEYLWRFDNYRDCFSKFTPAAK